jgi:hypothetical protein
MLFFVDESFQTVNGVAVGALGAVAIPTDEYNHFCNSVYRLKRDLLGASELHEKELKAARNLTRAQFKKRDVGELSVLLSAVDGMVDALIEAGAVTYGVWTLQPGLLTLRKMHATTKLTTPYIKLLHSFAHLVRFRNNGQRGFLFLDQVGNAEDLHAACMISNYLSRPKGSGWLRSNLIQVPHFTHSAVSPGLQAADIMAYLTAQRSDTHVRPELAPLWARLDGLAWYNHGRTDSGAPQIRRTSGEIVGLQWHTEPVGVIQVSSELAP